MLDIFQYQFIINALLVGSVIAIVAPVIGTFLVVKNFSAFADTIAHTSLLGIVLGLIFKLNPVFTAIITAIATALSIETIRKNQKNFNDSILVLFMMGGLGLSTILISLNKNLGININNYLFGSINTVTQNDIWLTLVISILVLSVVICHYKKLFQMAFDEEMALASGVGVDGINRIFMVLASLVVSVSIPIIGVLLVSSLMIIPVLTSLKLKKGFLGTMVLASIFGVISIWVGIIGSYYLDIATGGSIVMVNVSLYILVSILVFFPIDKTNNSVVLY